MRSTFDVEECIFVSSALLKGLRRSLCGRVSFCYLCPYGIIRQQASLHCIDTYELSHLSNNINKDIFA